MKRIVFLFIFALLAAPAVSADTVVLKNGKKITGKISHENSYSLRVTVNKVPYTYYRHEIESIEYEEAAKAAADPYYKYIAEDGGDVSEVKAELIKRLLQANGARESMSRIFSGLIAQAPEERRDELRQILKPDGIIESLIPVYSKYYTEAELRELLSFYSSPTGQKHVDLTPKLLDETFKATNEYFKSQLQGSKTP